MSSFPKIPAAFLCLCLSTAVSAQISANPPHKLLKPDSSMSDCLVCHQSYEAVAKRTNSIKPNPHESHRGEVDCIVCHKIDQKPHFECNDCHEFNIVMKGE